MKAIIVVLVALLGVVSTPTLAFAQGGRSPLMPPQSSAFGKPFEEWGVLYNEWVVATQLGGQELSDTVGRVRFLPNDVFNPSPEFDVTLPPGTPFVADIFTFTGEAYDDGTADDPAALAEFLELIFDDVDIRITLDDRVLLEGTGAELEAFRFPPTYFDEPIPYAEPQPRGENLNAVEALWVAGFGAVYHPLPVGEHTLEYVVDLVEEDLGIDLHYHFTYNITVSPT